MFCCPLHCQCAACWALEPQNRRRRRLKLVCAPKDRFAPHVERASKAELHAVCVLPTAPHFLVAAALGRLTGTPVAPLSFTRKYFKVH